MTIEERAAALEWAEALANEAGERAAAHVTREWAVHHKSDGTVVTDVDRAIEQFIRARIAQRFPDHAVLGEEYGLEAKAEGIPVWAIDPIDGTANLANRIPHWGVSIGLIADGVPSVGALCFPLLGERFAGARGLGATRNGKTMTVLPPGGPTEAEDTYGICTQSVRQLDFDPLPARYRILGSAALEICWVAAGLLRGCQTIGVSLWDVAAGLTIAHEVGADAAWLRSTNEEWSALEMLANGKREDDALITAPPGTRAYVQKTLRFR